MIILKSEKIEELNMNITNHHNHFARLFYLYFDVIKGYFHSFLLSSCSEAMKKGITQSLHLKDAIKENSALFHNENKTNIFQLGYFSIIFIIK